MCIHAAAYLFCDALVWLKFTKEFEFDFEIRFEIVFKKIEKGILFFFLPLFDFGPARPGSPRVAQFPPASSLQPKSP